MKRPRQWTGGFSVEELIKALQRVLEVEPGAQACRHPYGIAILDSAGGYAGTVGLPLAPGEPSDKVIPLTGLRFESGKLPATPGVLPGSVDGQTCVICGADPFTPCSKAAHAEIAEKTGDVDG